MGKLKNHYSFIDKIIIVWWIIRTKVIDRKVRLFRYPLIIRGRKHIVFGERLTTGVGCRFDCFSERKGEIKLRFGKDIQLNDYVHIVSMKEVTIGDNVLIASHVFISDNSHGSYKGDSNDSSPEIPPTERRYSTSPVIIGKNCWIGEGVVIMPGVELGEGCVIGAHSIVNKSIPSKTIAVGAPAKVIKKWDDENQRWMKV